MDRALASADVRKWAVSRKVATISRWQASHDLAGGVPPPPDAAADTSKPSSRPGMAIK